jgi:hypothetical protein
MSPAESVAVPVRVPAFESRCTSVVEPVCSSVFDCVENTPVITLRRLCPDWMSR